MQDIIDATHLPFLGVAAEYSFGKKDNYVSILTSREAWQDMPYESWTSSIMTTMRYLAHCGNDWTWVVFVLCLSSSRLDGGGFGTQDHRHGIFSWRKWQVPGDFFISVGDLPEIGTCWHGAIHFLGGTIQGLYEANNVKFQIAKIVNIYVNIEIPKSAFSLQCVSWLETFKLKGW